MMIRVLVPILLCLVVVSPGWAQQAEDVNAKIREEGMERSQVMEIMHHLTDVYGPRLTASPNLEAAGTWALEQLTAWGVENAHREPWEWGHPGWDNVHLSVHLLEPDRDALVAEVLAWTPGTDGPVTAEAYHLLPPDSVTQDELDAFLEEMRSLVEGKIVLVGDMSVPPVPEYFRNMAMRRDDEEVQEQFDPGNPAQPRSYNRNREAAPEILSAREVARQVDEFLRGSGALVRVNPARMEHGLIRAFSNRSFDPAQALPTLVMRNEDYGRLARLLAKGHRVTLRVNIDNELYPERTTEYNYIAEIPGVEKPDEVVMIGGHLDSWHAATGATDNAAGVAVMMEAMRILKALDLQPRRTIRIALWTGEEQGLLGSRAYVADHFGTFEAPKEEYDAFGGYINVDAGTGRLRGATVFGPTEAAAVLEEILAPFSDLGVAGARPTFSRHLGGSDHTAFNQAGLPGISMGQDPIQYFSHTWHTNVDTYERILEDDLKQAAVVVAATAYHLAMHDELLPRFDAENMPAAPPSPF